MAAPVPADATLPINDVYPPEVKTDPSAFVNANVLAFVSTERVKPASWAADFASDNTASLVSKLIYDKLVAPVSLIKFSACAIFAWTLAAVASLKPDI